MAVNNSIALGKTKGSIGNVTFARLKGQQISKSKVEPKGQIRPELQSPSQKRMKNIVMVWQVLFIFLAYIQGLRKPLESNFNAFVRIFKSYMADAVYASGWLALNDLSGIDVEAGNFIKVSSMDFTDETVTVTLNTFGAPFVPNSTIRILRYHSETSANAVQVHVITEEQWNIQEVVKPFPFLNSALGGAYVYVPGTKKCSAPYFAS